MPAGHDCDQSEDFEKLSKETQIHWEPSLWHHVLHYVKQKHFSCCPDNFDGGNLQRYKL